MRDSDRGETEFCSPVFDPFYKPGRVEVTLVARDCNIRSGVIDLHSSYHSAFQAPTSPLTRFLVDEAATATLGRRLAPLLAPGMIVWLDGDLGAGKTTLVRALLYELGHVESVKSPTYSLVEVYVVSSLYLYHFDFYRFNSPEEFVDAGLDEYFRGDGICLVEWPKKAAGFIPSADLSLALLFPDNQPEGGRIVQLQAGTERGAACLSALENLTPSGAN